MKMKIKIYYLILTLIILLYDMIMLKDNHIDFCGGITKAIQQTKEYLLDNHLNLKIIIEARNLKEIRRNIAV